ncbi:putative ATP-dependent RNA helicase DDX4 [Amblyomma americanum]
MTCVPLGLATEDHWGASYIETSPIEMYVVSYLLARRDFDARARTNSSTLAVAMQLMLEALEKGSAPGTSRECQHRPPPHGLRTSDLLGNEEVSSEKACFFVLGKGDSLLDMAFEPRVSFQVRRPSVPRRCSRRPLMSSVIVQELIRALPPEPTLNCAVLSTGILGGAGSDVQPPLLFVTQSEEHLKRVDVLACRDSEVVVAIMNEMAAGTLAFIVP